MQLSEIYVGLGEESFRQLLRTVSIGKLKTYQLYDRVKTRMHLNKVNSENLRKGAPRFWSRVQEGDEEFASDLAQAILVSHLPMIVDVLNFLEIPHDDGFFAKDLDASQYLKDGWQERVFEQFRSTYPEAALAFYLNHLAWELTEAPAVFVPQTA
ncbi:MAG: hypothetical protein ACK5AZ_16345 [Bryobacteraceae bacterium]